MTHTHWNGAGERHRAMTSPNRDRRLRDDVIHRTIIPVTDGRSYDVTRRKAAQAGSGADGSQLDRRKQVTYLPLQHVQSSLPSLFGAEKSPRAESASSGHGGPDAVRRSGSGSSRYRCYINASGRNAETATISRMLRSTTLAGDDAGTGRDVSGSGSGTRHSRSIVYYKPTGHVTRQDTSNVAHQTDRCRRSSALTDPEEADIRGRRAKSLPVVINPILKRQPDTDQGRGCPTVQVKGHRRRACFKQEVDICYFNTKDRPRTTIAMPRQSQNISCGAYIVDPERVKDDFRSSQSVDGKLPTPVIPPNQPLPCLSGDSDPERGIACSTEVTFIPFVDGKGNKGRLLRLNIRANGKCVRERTLVKALSGGGALIVHLFQNEAQDGGSAVLRRHVKKLALPVNIDPYRVRAHVHKDGLLTIEAPVMDCVLPNI